MRSQIEQWLYPTPSGLYCQAGDFYIDPVLPVDRALITHGHGDHARRGNTNVLASPETVQIMQVRYGFDSAERFETAPYGTSIQIGHAKVRFEPAGHILGSAQISIEHAGGRVVASGDYKRAADPTCALFQVIPCDVFITETTFALPVFRHENAADEAARLIQSIHSQPERTHLLGVYGLGKCQRMIRLMRDAGYDAPIYLHGALVALCELYERLGVQLGDLRPAANAGKADFAGQLVMCPPSAVADRWSRRFADPVVCFASGWMRVRGRARQRGVELPLSVSDHADWPELLATIDETGAGDVWVTHGRDEALVYQLEKTGRRAKALALVGRDDEED